MQYAQINYNSGESDHRLQNDDCEWLTDQILNIVDCQINITVSEWAEEKRYLPAQVTSMEGYYSFGVAPYLKEIANCMSITSRIQEVDFMKAAQVGATVGVLENTIGYLIDHVKSAPAIFLTADGGLAKRRVESNIIPMLLHSELYDLITSSDFRSARKTGLTDKKIEWVGGGYLLPMGAQNADTLRSFSIRFLLEDEIDAYPAKVGKDGDPQKLVEARTTAYHETRKILRISTPLIKGSSRITKGYEKGDQRKYLVPCKSCKVKQELRFSGENKENGLVYGLVWELDGEILIPDSVRYICKHCGHAHRNSDKIWMLPRGEWVPTSKARTPEHRSYHINALYSPIGMFPWSAIVLEWLEAWDTVTKTAKNDNLLQNFYNNRLGLPYRRTGTKVRIDQVSFHRRPVYRFGQIPNAYAKQYSGSPILFLTCQVDVHKRNLGVSVMGWTQDQCSYVIDYWRYEVKGTEPFCDEITSPVWQKLRDLIEDKEYIADNGVRYKIAMTLVDAGYCNATVTSFCGEYAEAVFPILGRDRTAKNQTIKEFAEFKTQDGTIGYRILVDHYKDRLSPVLRREWGEGAGQQKMHHFNTPIDITTKQLKELTVETRFEKVDDNGVITYFWHRPGNKDNTLWDLLVYGHAGVEIMAWNICIQFFELENVDWPCFWEYVAESSNDAVFCRTPKKVT